MQGLWLAGALGVGVVVVLLTAGPRLLGWFGADGEVADHAERYLSISAWGQPWLFVLMAANGSFHGRQNTRVPLVLAITGAVINLVVELTLINGLGYGIGASALSTVIAQVVVGTAAVGLVTGWARGCGASLAPALAEMAVLLRAGRALMIRTVALRGSFTASVIVAANIGVTEVAAHQIALNVWGTLALSLDAVAIAGQALTGRWLGAGDATRARDAAGRMIEVDVALGALAGVVTFVAREPLAQVFTTDPAVISAAGLALAHVGAQQPVAGLVFALDGILIGAGDLDYLARWMVVAAAAFGVAAALVVVLGAGLGWLWMAIGVFVVVRAGALWRRWRDDTWLVTGAPG